MISMMTLTITLRMKKGKSKSTAKQGVERKASALEVFRKMHGQFLKGSGMRRSFFRV